MLAVGDQVRELENDLSVLPRPMLSKLGRGEVGPTPQDRQTLDQLNITLPTPLLN